MDCGGLPWIACWCLRSESNQHLMITNQTSYALISVDLLALRVTNYMQNNTVRNLRVAFR